MGSSGAERYFVNLSEVVPPEERNVFRSLKKPETFRPVREAAEVGEPGVYTVELEEDELEKVEAAENVRYLEKVGPGPKPAVDTVVPSDADLRGHKADMLYSWGFTGRGIDVGVIDTGLGSGVASKFSIKAIRGEQGTDPYAGSHGSYVASLAVPRTSRLIFSRAINEGTFTAFTTADWVSALYWMVDTVGVHVVNMSFGNYSFSQTEQDAVNHATSKNVLLVASAGNDDTTSKHYPGSYDGVMAVGALDRYRDWARWPSSNHGGWVDLWAGGVSVLTYEPSGAETRQTGTSVAAPLVTFVKASLLTKGLTSIGQIGTESAVKAGAGEATPGTGGGGRLDGENASWKMADQCG